MYDKQTFMKSNVEHESVGSRPRMRGICCSAKCYTSEDKPRAPTHMLTVGEMYQVHKFTPDSKVHGANMGPIWGRQDPGGPHVGPMNFVIWVLYDKKSPNFNRYFKDLGLHL